MDFKTAVLEGVKIAPRQVFGTYMQYTSIQYTSPWLGACVVGTAMLGLNPVLGEGRSDLLKMSDAVCDLRTQLPVLEINTTCPACALFNHELVFHVAVHLNDKHRWTRENIADWVDGL